MSTNLLTTTELDFKRLMGADKTKLDGKYITIDVQGFSDRNVVSGKIYYDFTRLPEKRFLVPPKQFLFLEEAGPSITLMTEGFGNIVTRPSELLGARYSRKLFCASLCHDSFALLGLEDVRKRLNITYTFAVGDLNNESVMIGDNKKVRTYIALMDKDDPDYRKAIDYTVLGRLVVIFRKSKNAAPDQNQIGLLTATGILYRLEQSESKIIGYTPIGCLTV